jgi:prepilin-type N-terminal cleavage/methylation domain-containing protein
MPEKEPQMLTRTRHAFTLVEVLIVVVILGIVSAVIVPLYANATQESWEGSLQANLRSLQNQIELYHSRSNQYPDFASSGWTQMVGGQFIKAAPVNPAYNGGGGLTSVGVVTGATYGSADYAWVWNSDSATICASNFREGAFYTTDSNKVSATSAE